MKPKRRRRTPAPAVSVEPQRQRGLALRVLLGMALLMPLLYGAYYYPYAGGSGPERAIAAYLTLQAWLAGHLIHVFDPSARTLETRIEGVYAIQIVKDCSSLDAQALLMAAVLAMPGRWLTKLIGVVSGVVLVSGANLLRIVSLYFIGAFAPARFDIIHEEVWPLLLVMVACACFWGWASWAMRRVTP